MARGWPLVGRVVAGLCLAGVLLSAAGTVAVVGLVSLLMEDPGGAAGPTSTRATLFRVLWGFAFGGLASLVVATAALAAWWALVDRGWRVVAPALPAVVVTGYVVWFAAVVLPGIV